VDAKLMITIAICAAVAGFTGLHTMFMMAKDNRNPFVSFTYPVAFTIALVISVYTVHEVRGYPVYLYPKGKFELFSHKIDGDTIFFWAVQQGTYRLYAVPATEKAKKAMEGMAQAQGEGKRFSAEFDEAGEVQMKLIDLEDLYPKGN
jgi:hypothetical protein